MAEPRIGFRDTMDRDMTYEDAICGVERVIAKNSFAKADVFLCNYRGQRFILKDFTKKGFWERNLIGRVVIAREHRAYRALAGVNGFPAGYKRLSPFALAIEYLEGTDLGSVKQHEIGPGVVLQFERIVDSLHERGWVHLDLQRRSNILLVGGNVFVIDLASAFHPGGVPIIGRMLLRLLGFADRLSLLKLKYLFAPELMSPEDRKLIKLRNMFASRSRRWHGPDERVEKRIRKEQPNE